MEVSSAVNLSDGALVLIDVIEGVSPQTTTVIRQAWQAKVRQPVDYHFSGGDSSRIQVFEAAAGSPLLGAPKRGPGRTVNGRTVNGRMVNGRTVGRMVGRMIFEADSFTTIFCCLVSTCCDFGKFINFLNLVDFLDCFFMFYLYMRCFLFLYVVMLL